MELPEGPFDDQLVDVLRDLVRIDTTNPPGNETAAARYLADLLAPAGIDTQVIESEPGRGNLIARLRGTGEARPLMLMGHLDVVAANPSDWSHPPFAAEIHGGFLWGRGSTDMKSMIAACAVVMMALASLGRPLKRDIVFAATADEEHGGRKGIGYLTREMPELFEVECAINEGGGTPIEVAGRQFYTYQSAEKGICRTVWTAHGRGGHGAYPHVDMSTFKLTRALRGLGNGRMEARAGATMRRALEIVAAAQSDKALSKVNKYLDLGQMDKAMASAGFSPISIERTWPLFCDTASLTGLRAGDPRSINVIPPTATAYVDGRLLPGQTREGFLDLLRECARDDVEIDVYNGQFSPGLESSTDHPLIEVISRVIAERCDGAATIPWQCAGSTDAKHLIPIGVPVYGFVPVKALPEGIEGAGAHANDERAWLDNLPFTLRVLYDVVYRFCSQT